MQPEKLWFYRNIFKTELNLSFHAPTKDLCDACFAYDRFTAEEKSLKEEDYSAHFKRK